METGLEHRVSARGEKRLAGFQGGKADARLLNSGNKAGLRPGGRGKENNFCPPRARNVLITLDSGPEMEGNGNIWKGLSGPRCARSRFDRAWLRIGGVFWKEDGFAFTEAVGRRRGQA
jgi:hypothetical protein